MPKPMRPANGFSDEESVLKTHVLGEQRRESTQSTDSASVLNRTQVQAEVNELLSDLVASHAQLKLEVDAWALKQEQKLRSLIEKQGQLAQAVSSNLPSPNVSHSAHERDYEVPVAVNERHDQVADNSSVDCDRLRTYDDSVQLHGRESVYLRAGAETSDEDELLFEPPTFECQGRRPGVSAEPTGAFNKRFEKWEKTKYSKEAEYTEIIEQALEKVPLLSNIPQRGQKELAASMFTEEIKQGDTLYYVGRIGRCAYVMLSGRLNVTSTLRRGRSRASGADVKTGSLSIGDFFGASTMLFGFRRAATVVAEVDSVVAVLPRITFFNIVTRHEIAKAYEKQSALRNIRLFEILDDEVICKIVDVMDREVRRKGHGTGLIYSRGQPAHDVFLVWEGEVVVTAMGGDETRLAKGDMFGEEALFCPGQPRKETVRLSGNKLKLLILNVAKFERMFGKFQDMQVECKKRDPRSHLTSEILKPTTGLQFIVCRPTSRCAIRKMIHGLGVGKGLNVKGKSALMNHLSGFVPFLQISDNDHKSQVEPSPSDARITLYFRSKWARTIALAECEALLLPEAGLNIDARHIELLDDYPDIYGLEMPEAIIREVYIIRPDISPRTGWENGRASEPAFMDMNLHAVRSSSQPKVVLYQFDQLDPMNCHGLLIAYAETSIRPVVSDIDLFTIGHSANTCLYQVPLDQQKVALKMLQSARSVIRNPTTGESWSRQWIQVMKEWESEGFKPALPTYGFSDGCTLATIRKLMMVTQSSGAVRHGAESYNFTFPQELDAEYLVIWSGFKQADKWEYMNEKQLRTFLMERIAHKLVFPINPIWPIRDPGWHKIYKALEQVKHGETSTLDRWLPPQSELRRLIDETLEECCPRGLGFAA